MPADAFEYRNRAIVVIILKRVQRKTELPRHRRDHSLRQGDARFDPDEVAHTELRRSELLNRAEVMVVRHVAEIGAEDSRVPSKEVARWVGEQRARTGSQCLKKMLYLNIFRD